jgi:hypothetical protein
VRTAEAVTLRWSVVDELHLYSEDVDSDSEEIRDSDRSIP